jgi:hypothetical protein
VDQGIGGDGGGGGGSIEISAGGDLQVSAISARGAAGAAGSGGAGSGGGGSGGVILLRAGGSLSASNLDASGGGAGAAGRVRYDAATVSAGPLGTGLRRGPMLLQLPAVTRIPRPKLVIAGQPLAPLQYFFIAPGGAVSPLQNLTIDMNGIAELTLAEDLAPGATQVCVTPPTTAVALSETRNCAVMTYLP